MVQHFQDAHVHPRSVSQPTAEEMPPVTTSSLAELDTQRINNNLRLRDDVKFDSELQPSARLYLGNLPFNATKADIEDHCNAHGTGEITDIKLFNGFGFVEYKDWRDARDVVTAFHGSDFMGERIVVSHARGRTRHGSDSDPCAEAIATAAKNITDDVEENEAMRSTEAATAKPMSLDDRLDKTALSESASEAQRLVDQAYSQLPADEHDTYRSYSRSAISSYEEPDSPPQDTPASIPSLAAGTLWPCGVVDCDELFESEEEEQVHMATVQDDPSAEEEMLHKLNTTKNNFLKTLGSGVRSASSALTSDDFDQDLRSIHSLDESQSKQDASLERQYPATNLVPTLANPETDAPMPKRRAKSSMALYQIKPISARCPGAGDSSNAKKI